MYILYLKGEIYKDGLPAKFILKAKRETAKVLLTGAAVS